VFRESGRNRGRSGNVAGQRRVVRRQQKMHDGPNSARRHCLAMSHNSARLQRRNPAPQRDCLFCGTSGPLTDEHVYGKWLRKLGYTGEGVREIVPGDGSERIIQRGGPFSKTLKIVCRPCNNEWMSGMETAAEPLLTAMFNACGSSLRLDETARLTLARWAFKTIANISRINYSDPFPLVHRREFRHAGQPPQHAQVRIGAASIPVQAMGENLAESRFEPRSMTVTGAGHAASFPFYRGTFRLITVVFDIVGYVTDDYEMGISPDGNLKRALLPLWPSAHPSIWWPPSPALTASAECPDCSPAASSPASQPSSRAIEPSCRPSKREDTAA